MRDWERKKLGEVLKIERGGSPRPIEKFLTNSSDGINWIKISDATASEKYIYKTKEKISKDGLHKTRIVNEGDFILSNSMSFGRPYIMKTIGCIHDGWLVLRNGEKKVFESEFLYYLLSSPIVFDQFNFLAAGSTVRNLNIALVSSVKVPIPPLPEQQCIVSILDEAFAAIAKAKANAEKNLKNAKELFESYLQGVFEKKGEGWEEKSLGDIANTNGRIGWKGLTAKEYTDKGPLFLSVHSLNYGDYVNFKDAFHISQNRYDESPEIMLQKDDILICKDGAGIGKLAIVPELPDLATINSSLLLIRCKNVILSKFLYYNLLSPVFQAIVKSRLMGSTTPHLYQRDIVTFPIVLPNLSEQKIVIQKLDTLSSKIRRLETLLQKKIDNLDELKKSILQKAFTGELTAKEPIAV